MDDENKTCKRCGKCCYYVIYDKQGEPLLKKCRHLVKMQSGKTLCREYNKRKILRYKNGIKIDSYKTKDGETKHIFCIWREGSHYSYEGCPYNVKGAIPYEKYLDDLKVTRPH